MKYLVKYTSLIETFYFRSLFTEHHFQSLLLVPRPTVSLDIYLKKVKAISPTDEKFVCSRDFFQVTPMKNMLTYMGKLDVTQQTSYIWHSVEKGTQNWPRLKHLRSEPWICLRKNQNKEKEPFLKIASS